MVTKHPTSQILVKSQEADLLMCIWCSRQWNTTFFPESFISTSSGFASPSPHCWKPNNTFEFFDKQLNWILMWKISLLHFSICCCLSWTRSWNLKNHNSKYVLVWLDLRLKASTLVIWKLVNSHIVRSDSEHSGQKKSKNITLTIIMYTSGCCKLESIY